MCIGNAIGCDQYSLLGSNGKDGRLCQDFTYTLAWKPPERILSVREDKVF